jgi:Fe2+ or Zn2+ uptake regulation protein
MQYVEYAKRVLKDNGNRITRPRVLILVAMSNAKVPQNAYDIATAISEKGEKIDVTTVYRFLEVCREMGLVHFVQQAQGYMPCEDFVCDQQKHCHHQFVCNECETVSEIHFDDESFLKSVQKQFKGIFIENHSLELSGLCKACR